MSTKPIAEFGVTHFKGISVKEKGAEGRYVLVPSGAVFPKHIKLDRCKRFTDDPAKLSQKFLQANDVLFNSGGVGTLGRSHHISEIEPKTYVPDSFVLVLRTNGEQLLSKYLYYYLQSPAAKQLIEDNTRGTIGITSIKSEAVLGFPIPCPSLVEQQRIVRQLDDVFEGIALAKANAEKNLQNAYKLLNVYLASVFTNTKGDWDQKYLGDVCTFENGDRGENYPSASVRTPTGVPFINAGHLIEGKVDFRSMDFIPKSRFALLSNGKIRPGDILFCLRGSLGKFATVGDLSEGAIASSLVIIRTKKMLLPEFLLGYLKSPLCAAMIQKHKGGTAQPNLSAASLRSFVIPLPQISDQERVVDSVNSFSDAIDRLSEIYKTKVYALSALENSILNRSFVSDATAAL